MAEENATNDAPSEEPNLLGSEEQVQEQPEAQGITPVEEPDEQFPEPSLEKPAEEKSERPEWLPEKFKNAEALAESYKNLEKRFHQKNDIPEKYEITYNDEPVELDEGDQEFFKDLGLSQKQASTIYTQLMDTLVPQLQQAHLDTETAKLSGSWNMETGSMQFQERMQKVSNWATEHLPEEVVKNLRSSAKGVEAMFSMMRSQKGEGAQPSVSTSVPTTTPAQLKDMVKDPRYYTDQGFQEMVEKEFKRYYDNG